MEGHLLIHRHHHLIRHQDILKYFIITIIIMAITTAVIMAIIIIIIMRIIMVSVEAKTLAKGVVIPHSHRHIIALPAITSVSI